jgi:hypothetical protein
MDHFFGAGKPWALFKRPANVYTFHVTVMASVDFVLSRLQDLELIHHRTTMITLKIFIPWTSWQ